MKKIDYKTHGNVVVLRLNDPPLNLLTFEMLNALASAIDRANDDPSIVGIVIMGSTEHFSAGADINLFRSMSSYEEAIDISRRFQETFNRVEQSEKPVCAAVAGNMMDGALELALACHYRVCATETSCSFPEVNLGIIPPAGGTQRLPRTVGAVQALDMLLSEKKISAYEAVSMGLVDAVCEPSKLVSTAQELLISRQKPQICCVRTDKINNPEVNSSAFDNAREKVSTYRKEIIAPQKIIDPVVTGINGSFKEGLVKEQTGFAKCISTTAAKNKIYLFFSSRLTSKIPRLDAPESFPIKTTAVVGIGSMGSGIAQAFAIAGKNVIITDVDQQTAEKGLSRITESLERKIRRGALTREQVDSIIGRISIAKNLRDLAPFDLVIEAVFENIELKKSLLSRIAETMTKEGLLGQKSGRGVYSYEKNDPKPKPNDRAGAIISRIRADSDIKTRNFHAEKISERLVFRMVSEGFRVIEDGIALRESDIDVAMVMGAGFPDFRGGVLKYARDLGLNKTFEVLSRLTTECGNRYQPCSYLQSQIKKERSNDGGSNRT